MTRFIEGKDRRETLESPLDAGEAGGAEQFVLDGSQYLRGPTPGKSPVHRADSGAATLSIAREPRRTSPRRGVRLIVYPAVTSQRSSRTVPSQL